MIGPIARERKRRARAVGAIQSVGISAAPAWRARTIAPAKGQTGAAEFDTCQIRQENDGHCGRWGNGLNGPDFPGLYPGSPRVARTTLESRVPENRLSDLPVAGRSVRLPERARLGVVLGPLASDRPPPPNTGNQWTAFAHPLPAAISSAPFGQHAPPFRSPRYDCPTPSRHGPTAPTRSPAEIGRAHV